MPFLELQNISKSYGGTNVLRDVNLQITEGEFVAIIGYSGAGKTTLMSILAGLTLPDTGSVNLEGTQMSGPGPDRAIVFQNYSLLPWMSVFENVCLAVNQVFGDWTSAKRKQHVEKYLAMVNLTAAKDKLPSQLSGGMRQRVSVARALAMNPRVLLMDEPLSALDALTRSNLQDEIEHIWSSTRKTVVLVTNDVDEGILLADRIIPLSKGPGATLGPSIPVKIDRPRDRKAINHNPQFKAIRKQVFDWLLNEGVSPSKAGARDPLSTIKYSGVNLRSDEVLAGGRA